MIKTERRIVVSLLLVLGIVIAGFFVMEMKNGFDIGKAEAQPSGGGNILYVGGTGPNNYTKIQDAINAASDGDTIFVYSGVYYENVAINKRITLIGEDRDTTIINGGGNGKSVNITLNHAIISGFTISGGGIQIYHTNHVSILNCSFSYNSNGIYLDSSLNNNIYNCNIYNNSNDGIYAYYSNSNSIYDCNVSNNGNAGIRLRYSYNNSIYNCNISNNGNGIVLESSYNNSIYNCNISNHSYGIWLGSYFSSSCSYNNSIYNCDISNNGNGIVLNYPSNNNSIYNCNISNNWGDSIHGSSYNNFIYMNNFMNNNVYSGSNVFHSPLPITYTYNGNTYTNYLGNYWDDYSGSDNNGDGIGDTPYSITSGIYDYYPLMQPWENYVIGHENQPPTCSLSVDKNSGYAPLTVTFTMSASDSDGSISSWALDVNNNDIAEYSGSGNPPSTEQYTYNNAGTYTAKLTVEDNNGAKAYDTVVVTISSHVNQPPVADAGEDKTVFSGDVVYFDASASYDPDGTITSYTWNFGDGDTANGKVASHRFRGGINQPKTYTITLTVKDNKGASNTDTAYVTVKPLEKSVEAIHHPAIPIPGQKVFAKMTVTYNWVYKQNNHDVYIISKIKGESDGFYGNYEISIFDMHSSSFPGIIWSDYIVAFGSTSKTYFPPFTPKPVLGTSCSISKLTFNEGTFEGIEVYDIDAMNILMVGFAGISVSEGPSPPFPFPETNSVCFFPGSSESPGNLMEVIKQIKQILTHLLSPGELRIYDSEGRVTGVINGTIKEEIPYSYSNNNTIIIFFPNDTYYYEVVGTGKGEYGLEVTYIENGSITNFTAMNISISKNATHRYDINWSKLSQGKKGVSVKIDNNGDGEFEKTGESDNELTEKEYNNIVEKKKTPGFEFIAFVTAIAMAFAYYKRRRK